MKLSIVIPTLNESDDIKESLENLKEKISNKISFEILVVDGGSTDNTIEIVNALDYITLIHSDKGRGKQMNTGVTCATGNVLYFLHADSKPPNNFDQLIMSCIKEGKRAGCFRMKFDYKHWWLFLAGWFTQFNLKFFRGGDQSLFIEKSLFQQVGGYPEDAPIFEDYELIRKLYEANEFTVIQKPIITSARRYKENGVATLQYHYWLMYIKKWFGASKEDLYHYYKEKIK